MRCSRLDTPEPTTDCVEGLGVIGVGRAGGFEREPVRIGFFVLGDGGLEADAKAPQYAVGRGPSSSPVNV